MSERTFGRKKAGTSNFSNPSLVSPTTPTLANPVRDFGLPTNNIIQTATEESTNLQETQSADEQSLLSEVIQQQSFGHDISRIALRRPQAKLTVGEPDDKYEQEADWMANQVMRMVVPDKLNTQSLEPVEDSLQRKCTACEQEEDKIQTKPSIQTANDGGLQAGDNIESRLNSSKGGGSALSDEVRSFMEPRFGADFSSVRVHTDSEAVQMSRELGAQAFTHGSDVYYGAGKSAGNNELTAHELTHVVQQTGRVQSHKDDSVNLIQRDKNQNSDVNQQDLIQKAIDSKDPGDVKAINPFRFNLASIEDRFKLLDILLNHNSFVGPNDANVIEKIWNSFGKNLGEVASKYFEVWKQCNSHTLVNLEALPELVGMKLQFKQAIAARARGYLEDNKKLVKSELVRLGLDNPNAPATAEQSGNIAEIVKVAKLVKDAQEARVKLGWVDVGYRHPTVTIRPSQKVPVKFNPFNLNFKPELPPDGTENPPMPTWDQTKEVYDKISAIIDGYSEKYPAIFALIRDNKIDEVAQANDQAKIRQTIEKPLKDTFDNIVKTEPLLNDPGSDFPLELEPIHRQFLEKPGESPWNLPFQKSIAKKAIEEHGNQEFWKTIGVGTMQLALFIVAEFATGGLATFFLIAGAITSAGQATESWQKYDQTQSAANTNLSKETAIISQDQANHALGEAVLTTIFAFLDLYGAGKALSTEVKGLKASKLATAEAKEATTLAEATEAANKSAGKLRNEFKVEKTATGETHEFKFFEDGTIRRCSDPPCNFLIDSFKARADKALNELAADSPLRQQAESLSKEASAIQEEYSDLVKKVEKLPEAEREAQLAAGEAPIRQRLEKVERSMADLEVQVGAGVAKSFPKTVSYGKNYLEKFRKHAEQIRRTTGNKGIGKVSSAEGQAQIKAVIEDIVISGETRQQRYMSVPDALWSQKGNAIVIRQANGEFVTFLEAGKGAAQ
ncbi:MAG: DUF4157 domain-containing protein [Nostoc sp.]|uniref:eCIS core domain-containing protein n=1 Tax=Nostoc sp. TaxID=1180 RepID=UPI002FF5D16A